MVQRETEIDAFTPELFYTAELDFGDFAAVGEKFKSKDEANAALSSSNGTAVVRSIESKEKSEKAPPLYDLTTLQRDANRILGYTAQQTLDYTQSLYEKKLCTYPRTDSRYLTNDMKQSVPAMVLCACGICGLAHPTIVLSEQICNSKKVTDHHAIIPTMVAGETELSELPRGEWEILMLIARQVLRAVSEAHRFRETTVEISCGDYTYTAKGKMILTFGWKAYNEKEVNAKAIPELNEGTELKVLGAEIKGGETKPPAHFTEGSLLSAMETAGSKDMPEDAERKGLGTPATRASTIEKLISTGFVERKKTKKGASLVPARTGVSLITVLPEQLQSPLLTAEWEHKLKMVEHGEMSAAAFMAEIEGMVKDLVSTYQVIDGAEVLFPSGHEVVGKCPRCGGDVTENKVGFFCEDSSCRFGVWKNNNYLVSKKIVPTKKLISILLKEGRIPLKNIYSERTGKYFDATLTLTDDGTHPVFGLEFEKKKHK